MLTGFCLSLLGLIALSLTRARHRREALAQRWNLSERYIKSLSLFGYAALISSAGVFVETFQWGLGLVYLAANLSAAALMIALLLSLRPLLLTPLAVLTLILFVGSLF